jgi:hypothetical protein
MEQFPAEAFAAPFRGDDYAPQFYAPVWALETGQQGEAEEVAVLVFCEQILLVGVG